MTTMTKEQLTDLAEHISKLGKNVQLEDYMGALGVVVFNGLLQFSPEDRLQAVTAWCGVLFRQLAGVEHKRKSN